MSTDEWATADAVALAAAIRSDEVSAREVVAAAIDRIEGSNPDLNAVVATRFEAALAEVDAGLPDGPLRGVPILIKDLGADVAGLPSTRGSRLWADRIATQDSELVRRYRAAGMVVLGSTNTPELGKNASTESQLFGPARNPWSLDHSPGGSSGGAGAAVSAGMVPAAHGNDGGGSIRIPASLCGLFGLKPSRGRVSTAPYASTLAGPVSASHVLTTSVRDSALLLDLTSGGLPGEAFGAAGPRTSFLDATNESPRRLRIGVVTELRGDASTDMVTDDEVIAPVLAAATLCEGLGHKLIELPAPWDPADVGATSGALMGADLVVSVEDQLAELGRDLRDDDLEPFTRVLLDHYSGQPASALNRALRRAVQIGWEVGAVFDQVDVMLTPVLPQARLPLGVLDTMDPAAMYERAAHFSAWTSVANVTGLPAMSVPWGRLDDGLPAAVQFVADMGAEETLLSLAAQLEQVQPWVRHATR